MKFKEYYLKEAIIEVDVSFLNKLNKYKNKICNKDLGTIEIIEILNSALKENNIKFFQEGFGESDNPNYSKIFIRSASIYDSGLIGINVEDDFWKIFEDNSLWDEFILALKNIISHELVHKNQIEKVNKKKDSSKILDKLKDKEGGIEYGTENIRNYLSKKWELMAFAKEAVEEFKSIGYNKEQILKRVKSPFSKSIYPDSAESHIFYRYVEYFDSEEKPLQDFLKYMYLYLQKDKNNEKDNWIEKLSNFELKNYKKKHPKLEKKTEIEINKEIIKRKI